MKNKCLECGSPKKLLSVNYAGFDVKEKGKNVYPFMDRIEEMILPGNKKTDFLCVD